MKKIFDVWTLVIFIGAVNLVPALCVGYITFYSFIWDISALFRLFQNTAGTVLALYGTMGVSVVSVFVMAGSLVYAEWKKRHKGKKFWTGFVLNMIAGLLSAGVFTFWSYTA